MAGSQRGQLPAADLGAERQVGGEGSGVPVPRPEPSRRAAYGSGSPRVGPKGVATRQSLLDLALGLFAEDGFWGMSIEDLAKRAEVSRATVYQYFDSKDQLFDELCDAAGRDILRLGRDLQPLGPTAEGFQHLLDWLAAFRSIYDRYEPVFLLWSEAVFGSTRLRSMGDRFVDRYTQALAARLSEAGATGPDAGRVALAVLGCAERVSLHARRHPDPAFVAGIVGALAVTVQLTLFPATPESALLAGLRDPARPVP
jgi:AcrR family transcriptional regulator